MNYATAFYRYVTLCLGNMLLAMVEFGLTS